MNRALFLDRDGVVNKEINYLHKIEDVEFIDGVFETSRFFADDGYLIIIVTNQAGIGRGVYSEEDFHKLNNWIEAQFQKQGVAISKTYFCPYHPTEGIGKYKKDSYDRKPNPGMIFKARDEFDLNLAESILVGDKESDIEAGRNAGVALNVLVRSGHPIRGSSKADLVLDSVKELPAALKLL